MKEFIQEKGHLNAKFATKHFHEHQFSKSMKEFILVIDHLNAKLVTKHFLSLENSESMKELILVKIGCPKNAQCGKCSAPHAFSGAKFQV